MKKKELKAKIKELEDNIGKLTSTIDTLIEKPDSMDACIIRAKYKAMSDTDKAILRGYEAKEPQRKQSADQ